MRPPAEALDGIDTPADDNTWHDTPDFSKDNVKKQVQGVYRDAAAGEKSGTAPGGDTSTVISGDTAARAAAEARDTAKATAQAQRARAKAYLQRKVPQDRRDQTVFRLKVGYVPNTQKLSVCFLRILLRVLIKLLSRKPFSSASSTRTINTLFRRCST